MEWRDVRRRIEAGEDRRTEFKRGLGDLSAIGRAMCAFANTEGGVIIVGGDDSRGVTGVREDAERVQERLTSFLQTGCSQPVHARTGRREEPAGWVHWIDVPRQRGFEPLRYDGRVWVRRERSSVEPSATELQELYNAFGYITGSGGTRCRNRLPGPRPQRCSSRSAIWICPYWRLSSCPEASGVTASAPANTLPTEDAVK